MKVLKICFALLLTTTLFTACFKDDPAFALVQHQGTWEMTRQKTKTYVDGQLVSTEELTNLGTMSFDDDGSGKTKLNSGEEESFTWNYDRPDKEISITADFIKTIYNVNDSDRNTQMWHRLEGDLTNGKEVFLTLHKL